MFRHFWVVSLMRCAEDPSVVRVQKVALSFDVVSATCASLFSHVLIYRSNGNADRIQPLLSSHLANLLKMASPSSYPELPVGSLRRAVSTVVDGAGILSFESIRQATREKSRPACYVWYD